MPTDAVEDYLKAIHRIESRDGPPVSTSQIAEALDKTPATVTSMVETLADRGLLSREKYTGVELTPAGEVASLEVVRRHRLIESFLADQLAWDPETFIDLVRDAAAAGGPAADLAAAVQDAEWWLLFDHSFDHAVGRAG